MVFGPLPFLLWSFLTSHAYFAWNEAYKPKRERAEEEKKRWVHFPFWKLITFLTTASTCQNDPLFWRWRARVEWGVSFWKRCLLTIIIIICYAVSSSSKIKKKSKESCFSIRKITFSSFFKSNVHLDPAGLESLGDLGYSHPILFIPVGPKTMMCCVPTTV